MDLELGGESTDGSPAQTYTAQRAALSECTKQALEQREYAEERDGRGGAEAGAARGERRGDQEVGHRRAGQPYRSLVRAQRLASRAHWADRRMLCGVAHFQAKNSFCPFVS